AVARDLPRQRTAVVHLFDQRRRRRELAEIEQDLEQRERGARAHPLLAAAPGLLPRHARQPDAVIGRLAAARQLEQEQRGVGRARRIAVALQAQRVLQRGLRAVE